MASPDEGFLANYLPYLLRQADQTLSAPFYAVLTKYGVARSEWRVLAVLAEHDELCVADLAAEALSPQPTITHAVRRLEERGLITRTLGVTDKRQRFISISPAGAKLTAALVAEAEDLQADQLTETADLSELVRQLRDLTAAIEATAEAQPIQQPKAG